MRLDVFDVLVGINLLREGLDIPEISLVAIIDADKEGFLRSETSLIQTIGRAARNAEGRVIMYADNMTDSMQKAIDETARRRKIQEEYNKEHGITPQTIKKAVRELIAVTKAIAKEEVKFEKDPEAMDKDELEKLIGEVQKKMKRAATELDFETAATLRDRMIELKKKRSIAAAGLAAVISGTILYAEPVKKYVVCDAETRMPAFKGRLYNAKERIAEFIGRELFKEEK